jgi:P pilus assembly chaperone PapD
MSNIKKATTGLFITLALVLTLASPVSAGLRVSNAKIQDSISPGQVKTYTMNVGDTTNESMDVAVEVRGLGNNITGSIGYLTAEDDISPYSARPFITATPTSFHLEPGQSQDVTVNVNVPANVGDGGRYADVFIYTLPSGGGQIGISVAVSAQAILTIEGSNLVRTGKITSLDIPQAVSQQLFSATTTINNTGNYHYKVVCNGTVTNDQGQVVGVSWPTDTIYNLIPTFSRQVAVPLNISQELTPGTYTLSIAAYTQDGILLDTSSKTFVITDTYKPMPLTPLNIEFFNQGQLSVHQWSMAEDGTLMEVVDATSLDSTVSINILQGTKVQGENGQPPPPITVTAMDQPPTPPENYSIAKAYEFNPSGVQFDQPAHVTLAYTDSEIPAGADASQLSIATFNETTRNWDPIESEVDTAAHTITFPVTHFSVYALLTPPASHAAAATGGKTTWIWVGIGVLWVVVIAASIVIMQRRRAATAQKHKHRGSRTPRPQAPRDNW